MEDSATPPAWEVEAGNSLAQAFGLPGGKGIFAALLSTKSAVSYTSDGYVLVLGAGGNLGAGLGNL